jgi:hypothetical protein
MKLIPEIYSNGFIDRDFLLSHETNLVAKDVTFKPFPLASYISYQIDNVLGITCGALA